MIITSLQSLLLQLMGGGAILGLAVFWIMERIRWPSLPDTQIWFANLTLPQVKRAASILFAVGLAWLAFWAAVWFGYVPMPGSPKQAVEVMFPLAVSAITIIVSSGLHGAKRLDAVSAAKRSP